MISVEIKMKNDNVKLKNNLDSFLVKIVSLEKKFNYFEPIAGSIFIIFTFYYVFPRLFSAFRFNAISGFFPCFNERIFYLIPLLLSAVVLIVGYIHYFNTTRSERNLSRVRIVLYWSVSFLSILLVSTACPSVGN